MYVFPGVRGVGVGGGEGAVLNNKCEGRATVEHARVGPHARAPFHAQILTTEVYIIWFIPHTPPRLSSIYRLFMRVRKICIWFQNELLAVLILCV